jgi:BNR repeat-like domain
MFFRSAVVPRQLLTNFFLLCMVLGLGLAAQGQVALTQISSDPFTNPDSQHATEVEASTFFNGNTIVSAFQQGRYQNFGGSSDNGFATSTDGGTTWTTGSLPSLTVLSGGTVPRASDPAVAYDAKHNVWLIASLPVYPTGKATQPMLVSRSTDGGLTWNNPITFGPTYSKPDKTWLSCDNTPTSPFYGNCYAEWDNNGAGDIVYFAVSSDGGLTFGTPVQPSGGPADFGMQPLSQPNGTVIAVGADAFDSNIVAVTSTDGGATFTKNVTVTNITFHHADGLLRDLVLPTSAVDAAGKVYTVWQDCRFNSPCNANSMVMSTTTDGVTWSAVTRIPIGGLGSIPDVFLPGLAVEPGTSGSTAHLGLTYYFYPQATCGVKTCQLEEGYISSHDGGATWSAPITVAGAMNNTWFPNTNQGFMPGDYESLAFVNGKALPVVGVATARVKGDPYNVTMNVPSSPLAEGVDMFSSAGEVPVAGAHSDRPRRTEPVCDSCGEKD